jgi:hypothetical protein
VKLDMVLIELNNDWLEGPQPNQAVAQAYLDALVAGALDFRGQLVESRIIEGRGSCRLAEEPLEWESG